MNFKQLHQKTEPLLMCNVWDCCSALTAQRIGFNAIGTSSAAIASMLGYEDGQNMSFNELLYIIKRIAANTEIPLSVDIESGYHEDPLRVADHIQSLHALGVVGINIEDSHVNQQRKLMPCEQFTQFLQTIRQQLAHRSIDLFINVRTDTFLTHQAHALEQTIERAQAYQEAGADGIFVPGLQDAKEIKTLVENIRLPLNLMSLHQLPELSILKSLGVKRISMGNFVFEYINSILDKTLTRIHQQRSFKPIFNV